MKILTPHDFFSIIKGRGLVLDTSVFIDFLSHPKEFGSFLRDLKNHDVILLTLREVELEFMKGSESDEKLREREELIRSVVEYDMPPSPDVFVEVKRLLSRYKKDGSVLSMTDLLLAGTIVKYPALFLVTKNLRDFPTNIFHLKTCFHLLHPKAIHSYAIVSFEG